MRPRIPILLPSLAGLALLAFASSANAQDADPLAAVGQASADAIRSSTGADVALVAAGLFKDKGKLDQGNLAGNLLFPTDEILLLELSGAQLRRAFERSLLLYPQPNDAAFLYFSGGTVSFNGKAVSGARVTGVTLDAGFDANRKYKVATTASLAKGALGYFKVWDEKNIVGKASVTIESVLRGKRASGGALRWVSQG